MRHTTEHRTVEVVESLGKCFSEATLVNSKQGSPTPQTSLPVCNSLHHKVTGLQLAASATDHGLAPWLHHQARWLAGRSSVTPAPLHMAHDVTHKTGSTYHIATPPEEDRATDIDNRHNKKLSYRRVTARCVLSVVILPVATQQCRNYLYDKS